MAQPSLESEEHFVWFLRENSFFFKIKMLFYVQILLFLKLLDVIRTM